MMKIRHLLICLSTGLLLNANAQSPVVILKLDDLWFEEGLVHPGWLQVVDFLQEERITGTIGLVCESLAEGNEAYFQWIKDREEEGFEIWHHGFCHCKPMVDGEERREFRGTSAEFQKANLSQAHQLAKEKLGITFRTFGAPYNSTDAHTASALSGLPDIKIWLYKETAAPTDKFVLARIPEVNIEYPVHIPDFQQFKAGFEANKDEPVLVIQGHPRSWVEEPERFEEFKKIVHFLQAEGVRFTTPYSYYLASKGADAEASSEQKNETSDHLTHQNKEGESQQFTMSSSFWPFFNLAITWALVGLIWIVQLVHYPSFHFIADLDFPAFHVHHTRSISWIVLPLMLAELALGFWLAMTTNWSGLYLFPLVILGLLWLSTFLIQVPLHNALAAGKDTAVINRLVQTNWFRTILWTAKGLWLTWVVLKAHQ